MVKPEFAGSPFFHKDNYASETAAPGCSKAPPGVVKLAVVPFGPAFSQQGRAKVRQVAEFAALDFRGRQRLARRRDFSVERVARGDERRSFGIGAGEITGKVPKSDFGSAKGDRFFRPDGGLKALQRFSGRPPRRLHVGEPAAGVFSRPPRKGEELQEAAMLANRVGQAAALPARPGSIARNASNVSATLMARASVCDSSASRLT